MLSGSEVRSVAGTRDDNHRLNSGSPCLNVGVATDIDGNARISEDVVDLGAYERCHTVLPSFELPDWESDCDVDLADFAAFQACFDPDAGADVGCLMVFEVVGFPTSRCGFIDLVDYGVFAGPLSDESYCGGPTPHPTCCSAGENCCSEQMSGGGGGESMANLGGEAPLDSGDLAGDVPAGPEDVGPPAPPWTLVQTPVVVEIRPLGGGAPLTLLAADTAYEVYYSGATQAVEGYLLSATGVASGQPIFSASPVSVGAWSQTGMFEYLPLEDGAWVLDDLPTAEIDSGGAGRLCTITTGAGGELTLDLRMYLSDPAAGVTYEMTGTVSVLVGGL